MSIARSIGWVRILFIAIVMLAVPAASFGGGHIGVSITIAPPVLIAYSQPVCPGEGYIWTPGYWAWGDDGYFWVPGTWVLAPQPGLLWTPGYWGWGDGIYIWHAGYWGPSVGFYGGINYGFGYFGAGYEGGYWHEGHFFYNREVNNVNVTVIHNSYNKTVINNNTENRVSFNGGNGGTTARPSAAEVAAEHQRRSGPTSAQMSQQRQASTNRAQFASVNHGRPEVVATPKPGQFKGAGVVSTRGSASTNAPTGRAAESSRSTHANNNATSSRAAESSRSTHANNNATSSRAAESSRSAHANNNAASSRAAESSRPTHANNNTHVTTGRAAEPSRSARSESKAATSPTRENNVKSKSTSPRTESRPAEHAAKSPAQHESAPRPVVTQHSPRTEPKPTQHQAPPPAQHQTAQRPAMTQQAPHTETRSAQRQAAPPAQHGSAPRPEKKEPGR